MKCYKSRRIPSRAAGGSESPGTNGGPYLPSFFLKRSKQKICTFFVLSCPKKSRDPEWKPADLASLERCQGSGDSPTKPPQFPVKDGSLLEADPRDQQYGWNYRNYNVAAGDRGGTWHVLPDCQHVKHEEREQRERGEHWKWPFERVSTV